MNRLTYQFAPLPDGWDRAISTASRSLHPSACARTQRTHSASSTWRVISGICLGMCNPIPQGKVDLQRVPCACPGGRRGHRQSATMAGGAASSPSAVATWKRSRSPKALAGPTCAAARRTRQGRAGAAAVLWVCVRPRSSRPRSPFAESDLAPGESAAVAAVLSAASWNANPESSWGRSH